MDVQMVDSGAGGLSQSTHARTAGLDALDATATRPPHGNRHSKERVKENDAESIRTELISLVADVNKAKARSLLAALAKATGAETATRPTPPPAATPANIEALIKTTVQQVLAEVIRPNQTPGPRTWAHVAGQAPKPWTEPKMMVPARSARELVIKTPDAAPEIAERTPEQIVAAVKATEGGKAAVAARRLPSGDTIVTFSTDTPPLTTAWVEGAFGPGATAGRRQFTVIAKGLPRHQLALDQDLLRNIQAANSTQITKCQPRLPKTPTGTRAALIIQTADLEIAQALCETGLIWAAQVFDCEPFYAAAQPRRCYKCHEFGHIAKFCKKEPKCGYCAGPQHPDEVACPQQALGTPRCTNCKGAHPAWSRECPIAITQQAKAAEAYQHRPKQFELRGRAAAPAATNPPPSFSQPAQETGWTFVGAADSRKRRAYSPRPELGNQGSETPIRRPGRPRKEFPFSASQARITDMLPNPLIGSLSLSQTPPAAPAETNPEWL
jgi:hypothetical protein